MNSSRRLRQSNDQEWSDDTPPPPPSSVASRHQITSPVQSFPRLSGSGWWEEWSGEQAAAAGEPQARTQGQEFRVVGGVARSVDGGAALGASGRSFAPSASHPGEGASREASNPLAVLRGVTGRNSHGRTLTGQTSSVEHRNIPTSFGHVLQGESASNMSREGAGSSWLLDNAATGSSSAWGGRQPAVGSAQSNIRPGHYLDPSMLASLPAELTANVPELIAGSPVTSTRQEGMSPFVPRSMIPLRSVEHAMDTVPSANATRVPFASSSSAAATRSGSEGWMTDSNQSGEDSGYPFQTAYRQTGSRLADNSDAGDAFAEEGWVEGTGSPVGFGSSGVQRPTFGHHSPFADRQPIPVPQAQTPGYRRAGESDLFAPSTSSRASASNPVSWAAAGPGYEHPMPAVADHRHPFATTPPVIANGPARPQPLSISITGGVRSPGFGDTYGGSAVNDTEQAKTGPSITLIPSSPLDDGTPESSASAQPRGQRRRAAVERSPRVDLTSPIAPSAVSAQSTQGNWLSNFGRTSLEMPLHLDAISETSSDSRTRRGELVGEGRGEAYGSQVRLTLYVNLAAPTLRRVRPQSRLRERDSWWTYGNESEPEPQPEPEPPASPEQRQVRPSQADSEAPTLHGSPARDRLTRGDYERRRAPHTTGPSIRTVVDRPKRRDLPGLRDYLESRHVSTIDEQQNNTVSAIVRSIPAETQAQQAEQQETWEEIELDHLNQGSRRIREPDGQTSQHVENAEDWREVLEAGMNALADRRDQQEAQQVAKRQRRQEILSWKLLCICFFLPPAAVFFGLGCLDGVMRWWTNGEIQDMSHISKKVALLAGIVECILLVALAVTLPILILRLHLL